MLNQKVERASLILDENRYGSFSRGLVEMPSKTDCFRYPVCDYDEELGEEFIKEMIHAFKNLAAFIPRLQETRPQEYEAILADIFTEALQDNDASRVGYIRILLNAIDGNLLQGYLDSFIEHQVAQLKCKSEFRVAIEELYEYWFKSLRLKRFFPPILHVSDSVEYKERQIQLSRLKQSFTSVLYKRDINGREINLYPDDMLIELISNILDTGVIYNWLPASWNLDGFLVQLRRVDDLRRSNQLKASGGTLFSSKRDQLHIIKILAISHDKLAKRLQDALPNFQEKDYLSQTNAIEKINKWKRKKTALKVEISMRKNDIQEFEVLLKKGRHDSDLLPIIKQENRLLRRERARLEVEKSKLKKGIVTVDKTKEEGEYRQLQTGLEVVSAQYEMARTTLQDANQLIVLLQHENDRLREESREVHEYNIRLLMQDDLTSSEDEAPKLYFSLPKKKAEALICSKLKGHSKVTSHLEAEEGAPDYAGRSAIAPSLGPRTVSSAVLPLVPPKDKEEADRISPPEAETPIGIGPRFFESAEKSPVATSSPKLYNQLKPN
jgi:hypothetical protein